MWIGQRILGPLVREIYIQHLLLHLHLLLLPSPPPPPPPGGPTKVRLSVRRWKCKCKSKLNGKRNQMKESLDLLVSLLDASLNAKFRARIAEESKRVRQGRMEWEKVRGARKVSQLSLMRKGKVGDVQFRLRNDCSFSLLYRTVPCVLHFIMYACRVVRTTPRMKDSKNRISFFGQIAGIKQRIHKNWRSRLEVKVHMINSNLRSAT